MSTITAEERRRQVRHPEVTWRDAVTPLSRASRRRWTACYALLLILLAASVIDDAFDVDDSRSTMPLILFVALLVVFGMLRRGTRRVTALDHPQLDERDIAARNAAYRVAFPLLVLVLLATLIMLALALPDAEHRTRVGPSSFHVEGGSFLASDALVGLGLWIALWAVYLPTGVLAWREPDALEPALGGRGLPEPVRDALLAFALAGAIVLSLIEDSNAPTVLFVAALALLGALARRATGQPVMSRQRKWRVAIGIGIVLIIVALLFVLGAPADASGGGISDPGRTTGGS